jgi:hypothetical protein
VIVRIVIEINTEMALLVYMTLVQQFRRPEVQISSNLQVGTIILLPCEERSITRHCSISWS